MNAALLLRIVLPGISFFVTTEGALPREHSSSTNNTHLSSLATRRPISLYTTTEVMITEKENIRDSNLCSARGGVTSGERYKYSGPFPGDVVGYTSNVGSIITIQTCTCTTICAREAVPYTVPSLHATSFTTITKTASVTAVCASGAHTTITSTRTINKYCATSIANPATYTLYATHTVELSIRTALSRTKTMTEHRNMHNNQRRKQKQNYASTPVTDSPCPKVAIVARCTIILQTQSQHIETVTATVKPACTKAITAVQTQHLTKTIIPTTSRTVTRTTTKIFTLTVASTKIARTTTQSVQQGYL